MSFGGSDGGRGRGRGGGRYGGRGGGVGGGFGGEGGGVFGGGGHNPCPLCGNRHHPGQTCWPLCVFCGRRHHANLVCEPRQRLEPLLQQQQRQQQQQRTGYAGGHQGASMDTVLAIARQLQAENEVLRATVDALQTRFIALETRVIAFETRVNAAMASPLAPRASTQHGPTLAATQGVRTAGGITSLKRPRDEGVEANGQPAPPKKRRQRGGRGKKHKDESAESIKVEEGREEDLADDVTGPTPTPKHKPLTSGASVGSSLRSRSTLTLTALTQAPPLPHPTTTITAVSPLPAANIAQGDPVAGSRSPLPPGPLATVRDLAARPARTINGIDFSEEALLAAARPAAGFPDEAFARRTAQQLAGMPFYIQRVYVTQAENDGITPLAAVMRSSEAADAELQAAQAALPGDDADVERETQSGQ